MAVLADHASDIRGRNFRERPEGSLPLQWIVHVPHRDGSDRWLEVGAQGDPAAPPYPEQGAPSSAHEDRFRTVVIARDEPAAG
ncbi:MAG: hypothetical protein QF570_05295 [Myxococcota bacterium]|nr:hypothetical protein [Myxococcota bacterium]